MAAIFFTSNDWKTENKKKTEKTMEKDRVKIDVIFRKIDGEIIAIFPNEWYNHEKRYVQSYMHIGQHGACCPELIFSLEKPYFNEYEALKNELYGIGYDLNILSRRETAKLLPKFSDILIGIIDSLIK
jgi:hypothetical protein